MERQQVTTAVATQGIVASCELVLIAIRRAATEGKRKLEWQGKGRARGLTMCEE